MVEWTTSPANPVATPGRPARWLTANLRAIAGKSAYSLFDQLLLALAAFGVNLVLARRLPATVYGAFAVVFATYLWISGFHNVLVLEPLSVLGPACHGGRLWSYFRQQIAFHFAVVGSLAGLMLLASLVVRVSAGPGRFASTLACCAVALPLLLLAWLVRRMCYVARRPETAALGSAVYFATLIAAGGILTALHAMGPGAAFLLMGGASLLGSAAMLAKLGPAHRGETQGSPGFAAIAGENWRYGRWLLGSAVLFAATSQFQTLAAAGMLGLGSAGVLRAMQLPSLVMTQVVTAAGLLALPSLSYDFGGARLKSLHRKAVSISWTLALVSTAFAFVLWTSCRMVERLFYGGKYAPFAALMPLLALVPVFTGFTTGYSAALRASQKPQFDLVSNAIAAPISIAGTLVLIHIAGLTGAALSMVFGFGVLSLVTYACFRYSAKGDAGSADGAALPQAYSSIPFLNTLQQIARSDSVRFLPGLARHLHWQFRKLLRRFPCRVAISGSQLHAEGPCGVAALANAMGEYDYNNMRFVKWILASGPEVFVDVGASIGSYTLVASEIENARVISLEPHPPSYSALERNIALNQRKNVVCLPLALSDQDGLLGVSDLPEPSLNHIVATDAEETGFIVQSRRFHSLCSELGVNPIAVKIDVEGHELSVLEGFGAMRPRVVLVEGGQRWEVKRWMRQAGYQGPFWVHFRRGELCEQAQRRTEDPAYIRADSIEWLYRLGFATVSQAEKAARCQRTQSPRGAWGEAHD